jgi:hypothetical protein
LDKTSAAGQPTRTEHGASSYTPPPATDTPSGKRPDPKLAKPRLRSAQPRTLAE